MAPPKRREAASSSSRMKPKRDSSSLQDPYQSLVAEYLAGNPDSSTKQGQDPPRHAKRRRVGERNTDDEEPVSVFGDHASSSKGVNQQLAYEDFDDEESDDDSDAEFEDIDFATSKHTRQNKPLEDLDLVLQDDGDYSNKGSRQLSAARRQTLTSAHRKLRLAIHKMHILALITHVRLRNQWCNDTKAQIKLRSILSPAIRKMLKDDPNQTQWQRSRALKMGLEKATDSFKERFNVSTRGLSRPYWSESISEEQTAAISEDAELPITQDDFLQCASDKSGSRDVGAQLFCSMLRAIDLDVRLVCSLQPLPLQALMRPAIPSKVAPRVVAFHDTRTGIALNFSVGDSSLQTANNPTAVSVGVRRFGHASSNSGSIATNLAPFHITPPQKKRFKESSFPVYWVEVFNIADQKWIPVDPLVLKMIEKPSKFEPPANDYQNNMSYVIAVDEDGYIKDVTRRYAHAYNAKTRRSRIEGTRDGVKWWKKIMRKYQDPLPQDRDQVEDSELAAKEAREPMPRNIIEFKNHPYFALERHLRVNEVLNPKRQVGTVSTGVNKTLEPIYRRQDVHVVRSLDAWFRQGRQVKLGEEPLKYVEARASQKKRDEEDIDNRSELISIHAGTPLFAATQTQEYVPPPVFGGIIPKNIYGNIDIHVPSMVPAGGVWINHPFAGGAARLLGIDWADAVTGFEFRGRTGTAVVKGVVVAGEYHEAVVATIEGFQHAFEQEQSEQWTAQVLFAWKRFLVALRIRERIKGYHVEGEDLEEIARSKKAEEANDQSGSEYEDADSDDASGICSGGFLRDPDRPVDELDEEMDAHMQSMQGLRPLGHDPEPISKAVQDSRAPILSTWGPPLPAPIHEVELDASNPTQQDLANEVQYIEGGGGFLIDEDQSQVQDEAGVEYDQEAGGFTIDKEECNTITTRTNSGGNSNTMLDRGGGFFDADAGNQSEHRTSNHAAPPKSSSPIAVLVASPRLNREDTHASSSASSARGSLLSHDPDDEDAEPEWI